MELRVLGIPRMCSVRHQINPQLQQWETCSCAFWSQGKLLLERRSDTLHLKDEASPWALRVWKTRGYPYSTNTDVRNAKKERGWWWNSQQHAFLAMLINCIQKVMLQRDLEVLSPDSHLPWYLVICQFLVTVEVEYWCRIWKRRAGLAAKSVFWRFYFCVFIFIGLHFLLYFILEIAILMRKSSKSFQTTSSNTYFKFLNYSAEQAVNFGNQECCWNF